MNAEPTLEAERTPVASATPDALPLPDAPAAAPAKGWALVTGACSGIGLALARELAGHGYPVLLVSDRGPELVAAAAGIEAETGVRTDTIQTDLAHPDAARLLHEEVGRRGYRIEVLASNAGMFFFGEVADTDPARIETMMHLHVVTPSLLAHYFGRDMRDRRSGHILFTSSISAWREFPGIACYGSSKTYLRSLARSLREELSVWGVNVTVLAPGAVATNLYEQTGVPVKTAVKFKVMKDPASIAKKAVRGMLRGKAVVVPGLSAKIMAFFMGHFPLWLIKLVRRKSSLLPMPQDH